MKKVVQLEKCPKCGREYKPPKAKKGCFPANITHYLSLIDGKVREILFGHACPKCNLKIWQDSLKKMVKLGYMRKEGEAYFVLPQYR